MQVWKTVWTMCKSPLKCGYVTREMRHFRTFPYAIYMNIDNMLITMINIDIIPQFS